MFPAARFPRPAPLTPEQKAEKATRRRRGWAQAALVLSLLAVGVEGRFHLCASSLFDPLPDAATGAAYAWVVFFMWFNQAVLSFSPAQKEAGRQNPLFRYLGPKRAAGIAVAGTGVALLASGMAVWMFAPLLLAAPAIPLLFVAGLASLGRATPTSLYSETLPLLASPLILVPLLDFLVLLFQMKALRRLDKTAGANPTPDKRVVFGTRLLFFAAVFFLIVRPVLIGFVDARILRENGAKGQQAFSALRVLGGQETLLDLTYKRNPPYWVCFGYQVKDIDPVPWAGYTWNGMDAQTAQAARRAYFLMTGTPFECVPRPISSFRQNGQNQPDDAAIEETGGLLVGRPVPGLRLAASALELSTDAQTETGEGTWTMTFRNDADLPQEARADILLPPGGTCHAVSLWVHGREKPAAFGSPQKVRNAYQEVAVVRKRDPLLVTMPAPDHLLAQCFPVPAHGEMKIKLGITVPLTWRETGAYKRLNDPVLELICPALGNVNFEVPVRAHTLTLWEDKATQGPLIITRQNPFTPYRASIGTINRNRNAPEKGDVLAPGVVRTADPLAFPEQPVDVWFLVDASQTMNDLLNKNVETAIAYTLRDLPAGSRVFFGDTAAVPAALLEPFAGDPSYHFPAPRSYAGGTDPAPVLARTLRDARKRGQAANHSSVVVFLHAASPANVSDLSAVRAELHQSRNASGKTVSGPALVCVQLAPHAPDAVAMELSGFSSVFARRALPGDAALSLQEAVRFSAQAACAWGDPAAVDVTSEPLLPMGGRVPAVNGVTFATEGDAPPLHEVLSRLHCASLTTAGWMRANQAAPSKALDMRIAVGAPAAEARLVTPLSSAVVLKTGTSWQKTEKQCR